MFSKSLHSQNEEITLHMMKAKLSQNAINQGIEVSLNELYYFITNQITDHIDIDVTKLSLPVMSN